MVTSAALLDVNALIALLWKPHPFHASIAHWFIGRQHQRWATCPATEQGFVRIISNPVNFRPTPRVGEALRIVEDAMTGNAHHEFWPDGLATSSLHPAVRSRIQGRKQLTDAYLLSLAIRNGGTLITFDRRMLALAPDGSAERNVLEILI